MNIKNSLGWITPLQQRNLLVALLLSLTGNWSFAQHVLAVYPFNGVNGSFVISLFLLFSFVNALFFCLLGQGRVGRWVLAAYLIVAASAAYFMDQYGVVLDASMIQNVLQTNLSEANDLMGLTFFFRLLAFGLVPAYMVVTLSPSSQGILKELKSTMLITALLLLATLGAAIPFSAQYASFFREHKSVRYYANPTYPTYSAFKYLKENWFADAQVNTDKIEETALDARLIETQDKPELIVLVVGETVRADRFSLNGYPRSTNPELEKQAVLSFEAVASCGTSTAVSVPCMFSSLGEADFTNAKAARLGNVLDVLKREGVKVLWRDNNSDSKGVALRVQYEDFKSPSVNTVCDEECRDIGMLVGLNQFVQANADQDVLIVLHQMGNHGPAYYKRYPREFEYFRPACQSNELSSCTKEEIDNAYDNAVRYTDHFLNKTIEFLKPYSKTHETAMLYVSDHGESLGEMGLYLHGAPVAFAPSEQTHVASVLWFGEGFDYALSDLTQYKRTQFSHDQLFCGLLAAYEVSTGMCEQEWWRGVDH